MMKQMALDTAFARERVEQDAAASERLQAANLEFQRQQVAAQASTNEVLLKVGKASGEQRTRVKTEISPVTAGSAVSLFLELIEFDRQMTELQIGEADYGLRWR